MLYANRVPGVDASWQKKLLLSSRKAAIFSQGGFIRAARSRSTMVDALSELREIGADHWVRVSAYEFGRG